MATRRRADLLVALSGSAAVQSDFDTPVDEDAIDTAWAMTSDNYPNVEQQIDRILDCQQQDLVAKETLRRIMRFDLEYEADPILMAIHLAYMMSVAASPTGTPANQIERFTQGVGLSGGFWKIGVLVGSVVKLTQPLAWNATASEVKTAVENISYVGRGNTTVAFTPAVPAIIAAFAEAQLTTTDVGTIGQELAVGGKVYTISADGLGVDEIAVGADSDEFADNIAARITTDTLVTLCTAVAVGSVVTLTANTIGAGGNSITMTTDDPDITIDSIFAGGVDAVAGSAAFWDLTLVNNWARGGITFSVIVTDLVGGTITRATNTPAVQFNHALTRISGFQNVAFGLVAGFRNSNRLPKFYKSVVANTMTFRGSHADPRITASMGVIGSGEVSNVTSGWVTPNCQIFRPARFRDTSLVIAGVDYALNNLLRDFEISFSNGLVDDDDPYTAQDEDIHRLERSDQRPFTINAGILGEEGDTIHQLAEGLAEEACTLRIGRPGRNINFTIPKGSISLRNPVLGYDGTVKRSKVQIQIEPMLISGDATTPFTAAASVDISDDLLVAA